MGCVNERIKGRTPAFKPIWPETYKVLPSLFACIHVHMSALEHHFCQARHSGDSHSSPPESMGPVQQAPCPCSRPPYLVHHQPSKSCNIVLCSRASLQAIRYSGLRGCGSVHVVLGRKGSYGAAEHLQPWPGGHSDAKGAQQSAGMVRSAAYDKLRQEEAQLCGLQCSTTAMC